MQSEPSVSEGSVPVSTSDVYVPSFDVSYDHVYLACPLCRWTVRACGDALHSKTPHGVDVREVPLLCDNPACAGHVGGTLSLVTYNEVGITVQRKTVRQ